MRRIINALLLVILTTATAYGACDPTKTPSNCTLGQALAFYRADMPAAKEMGGEVAEEETNANRAVEPPSFASQLHNSYQDFLNLFGFAINKVEESKDGQALTIRFNPLRHGSDVLGATLTAAKPGVSDLVKNNMSETGRADVVRQLEGKGGELDDLTFSVSWARQTKECTLDRDPTVRCWGRDHETYRDWLSHASAALLATPDSEADSFAVKEEIVTLLGGQTPEGDVLDLELDKMSNAPAMKQRLETLAKQNVAETTAEKERVQKLGLQDLAALVDNQPQLTSSVSYHDAGQFGGPPVLSASFELQFGNGNINAIRSQCARAATDCFQTAVAERLKKGVSTMKWVLSGNYAENDDYALADLPKDVQRPSDFKFKAISEKSFKVITLKGQGGAELGATVGDKRMRADGSLEFERVTSGDPSRRKNRLVGKATFTVPFGDKMSMPISLTWANKEKYLGDQTKKFGVHFGISYRIPDLLKIKK